MLEKFNNYINEFLLEKKDRCHRKAEQVYGKKTSAYRSGAIVKCRQGKIWKKKKIKENTIKEETLEEPTQLNEKDTFSKEKESGLHGWFSRQGGKGKSKGWVDCNTCRKDKKTGKKTCKTCGRGKGEKRSKYPACRPTPSACNSRKRLKKGSKRISWKKGSRTKSK